MAQLSMTRAFENGEIMLAADIDIFLDDLEFFVNVTKFNDDNFQNGGIDGLSKVKDNTVTNEKLAANAITTDKIANVAVTHDKMAPDAVTTAKLADGAVTNDKFSTEVVTTANLVNGSVTDEKLQDDTITTIKIADRAVTAAKLLDGNDERDWVLGRVADSDSMGVGTYALAASSTSSVSFGTNRPGNTLTPTNSSFASGDGTPTVTELEGTWKCMGMVGSGAGVTRVALWMRVS